MGRVLSLLLTALLSVSVWADVPQTAGAKAPVSLSASVGEEICRALANGNDTFQIGSWIETTESGNALSQVYADTGCRPLWSDENGIDPQTLYMIHAINRSDLDGLDIYDPAYNLQSILAVMGTIKSDPASKNNPAVLAQLDILLTDAYLMLGKHLYYGVLPREEAHERWEITPKKPMDFPLRLREALFNNNLLGSLDSLSPSSASYQGLKTAMAHYIRIQEAGGWKPIVPADLKGERDEPYFIEAVKERLRAEGDLSREENSEEGYRDALIAFQTRHGVKSDGIVGEETLSKLNIPVEEKIEAIRTNMERWRWLGENGESLYISVNIPDFSLSVINDGTVVMKMRAILGKEKRSTHIFSARMRYIVVNPYWQVPKTILREDIIPKMQKNSRYLKKERIRIFKYSDGKGAREINPASIDWKSVSAETFPYLLRQDAGRKNVLGRLKFMFPNPYDIYIHDTPDKYLFEKKERVFSSGCIRIEEPVELANYLLEAGGDMRNIETLIAGGKTKNIPLSKSVKVYISYWSAWTDEEGITHFRDDVYGYDRELSERLGWHHEHE